MGRGDRPSRQTPARPARALADESVQRLAGDRTSTPCLVCRAGVYVERDGFDDMSGTLHCSHCGHGIARWVNEDDLDEGEARPAS